MVNDIFRPLPKPSCVFSNSPAEHKVFYSYLNGIDTVCRALSTYGTSTQRPTTNLFLGQTYFDTTLNQLVVWNGTIWASLSSAVLAVGTANSFIYTDANTVIATTTAANNGEILIGSTGNIPVKNTITSGAGIVITSGAGSITISNPSSNTANSAYAQANLAYDAANTANNNLYNQDLLIREPTGFPNRTNSTISFNVTSRIFTIAPAATTFNVYVNGICFTKNAAETVTIPDANDSFLIFYDNTGTLKQNTSSNVGTPDLFQGNAIVSFVNWNTEAANTVVFGEERHGLTMDWATHGYLHTTVGTVLESGLTAQNYTTAGDGTANADAQIGFTNGTIADEDIVLSIISGSPQTFSANATIPIIYQSGNTGTWKRDVETQYPVKFGSARIAYNLLTGNTWSTPDVTNNQYVSMWVVATNDVNLPLMAILGQSIYGSLQEARLQDLYANLNLGGIPFQEFKPIWKLIFQTNNSYTNAVKARLRELIDLRAIPSTTTTATTLSHSSLLNLLADDHPQYAANAAYDEANAAYTQANASANLVAVYANDTLSMANANINFNNTTTINVAVTANAANKRANVSFSMNTTAIVGGSNTQIQFNNNGVFGGSPNLVFDLTANTFNVGGQLLISSGTAALPGIAFTADPATGVRLTGANIISIFSGGLEMIRGTRDDAGNANCTLMLNSIRFPSVISPASITANTNDWAVANSVAHVRATSNAAWDITGIVSQNLLGRMLFFYNVGNFTITLVNQSASSAAANRFICPNSANVAVRANGSVILFWDTSSTRWRVIGA